MPIVIHPTSEPDRDPHNLKINRGRRLEQRIDIRDCGITEILLIFFWVLFSVRKHKGINPIREMKDNMDVHYYVQSFPPTIPSHRLSSCSGRIMNCWSELQFSSCGNFCMSTDDEVLWSCILTLFIFQLFSLKGSRIRPNTDSKTPTDTDAWVCSVPQHRISTIPWCSILKGKQIYHWTFNQTCETHFPRVPS